MAYVTIGLAAPKLTENLLYGKEVIAQHELSSFYSECVWKRKHELRNVSFTNDNSEKVLVIGDSNSDDLIDALGF